MRLANLGNRAALVGGEAGHETALDVERASDGRFGPDLQDLYEQWDAFVVWAREQDAATGEPVDRADLGAPSPRPRQVFAVGLNYDAHAAESGFESPTHLPPVFTKYVSSFAGPVTEVRMPEGNVDWEAELVVVIGREGHEISADDAWDHVAGLAVGQDISERVSQRRGPAPQFGLAKSFPGFSPQGPWLTTPDELVDRDALSIGCRLDDEVMQDGSTREMIFPVARLVEGLSRNVTLLPGDVIFTGTPAGVGMGREPQRFISPGQTLTTWIEGLGELRQTFVAG